MSRFVLLTGLLLGAASGSLAADRWIATWATAQQMVKGASLPGQRGPSLIPGTAIRPSVVVPQRRFPVPAVLESVENQTIRMVLRVSLGGSKVRVRLSNAIGASAVTIGSAGVGEHALTFGGQPSTTIYAGAVSVSDPVDMKVAPLSDLVVTLHIPKKIEPPTTHLFGLRPTKVGAHTTESYYWLAGVDVLAPENSGTIVALGDSITDGDQSTPDTNGMWPAVLAQRLQANRATRRLGIVNAGISGNRVLGNDSSALARLMHDALNQPGIEWLMLMEGINDITGATRQPGPPTLKAEELIAAYRQIIETAHLYGVKVVGCTLTPYGGSPAFRQSGEAIRQAVNAWIRTSKAFDAVVDFDAATRDPKDHTRFRPEVDSPDMLHPANPGYKIMAEAVDLTIFSSK
ncbi:MAG TPA: SGNH/GDSL hydrolase family protein [Bryobacteraceae bacterium]|nr:SGNH/GDSL hydrolase family protein [Bryobacteraceae bacterium]